MKLTNAHIEAARTENGGFTKQQLKSWGVSWPPPKGWKKRLIAGTTIKPVPVSKKKTKSIVTKTKKIKKPKTPRIYYLYALLLENDMYYVGMTAYKDAKVRYQQHLDGKGSRWTSLHKPIRMLEVRNLGMCMAREAEHAENIMTRDYMKKYGMYKVRGGDLCYVSPTLLALRFTETPGIKSKLYDKNGRRVRKTVRQARKMERIQGDIAAELSWIT